jgi:hypothetical protein
MPVARGMSCTMRRQAALHGVRTVRGSGTFIGCLGLDRMELDSMAESMGPGLDDERLVKVFEAPSEFEALAIQALLEHEGIEAAVQSDQMPMYDGLAQALDPVWGSVVVRESFEKQARELIEGYMEAIDSIPEESVEEDGEEEDDK